MRRTRVPAMQGRSRQKRAQMRVGDAGQGGEVRHRCPQCQEPCGTPTLLTSMVRYYTCATCGRSSRVDRDLERESRPPADVFVERRGFSSGGGGHAQADVCAPKPVPHPLAGRNGPGMSTPNVQHVAFAHPPLMIPGEREPGLPVRFAVSPEMPRSMVDARSIDAATIADRQREGGGAPRERRPARVSRWTMLMQSARALWPGGTSTRVPPARPSLAVDPSGL